MGRAAFVEVTSAGEFFADGFIVEEKPNGLTRITYLRERTVGPMEVVASVVMPTVHAAQLHTANLSAHQPPDDPH